MPQATDEALILAGKNERSRTLAKLYLEMAARAGCACPYEHAFESVVCPQAIWEQAARMAEHMIEE